VSALEVTTATAELNAYLGEVLVERKKDPGEDLISMMAASKAAEAMTDREVVANCTHLVFAGAGTTTSLMSFCVVLLAQHPEQRREIAEDRSLVPRAIEEVMRMRALVANPRIVTGGDAEIDGVRVPEGASVVALTSAANRDPERWERPHEFDVLRQKKQHLGFGFGMHVCLGLNLARLETEVYLNRLLDQLPEWDVLIDIDMSKSPVTGTINNQIPSIPIGKG
jgi:cytochrome P450